MKLVCTQRDPLRIEYTNSETGLMVAKAYRSDANSGWFFGVYINNKWIPCGEIYAHVPERVKRSMLIAVLEAE